METRISPSLVRSFVVTLVANALAIAAILESGVFPTWEPSWKHSVSLGFLYGIMVASIRTVRFVPGDIRWSSSRVWIKPPYGSTRELYWDDLVAYRSFAGPFLPFHMKFRDGERITFWIAGFSFRDWRSFRSFLAEEHPDKGRFFWIG